MAYIGRQSGQLGNYIRCNTITPDGSTTTFALTNVVNSQLESDQVLKTMYYVQFQELCLRLQHLQLIIQI